MKSFASELVNSTARRQPGVLPFCFQLQCQARRPLCPVSGAIVDEWPGLWVLSCQVTHSASCLTAVPVPLPAVGIPAPVLGKLALKKPDSIAGHTAFFSAAPVLGPALRSASSLHCYKLFFFLVSCSLHGAQPHCQLLQAVFKASEYYAFHSCVQADLVPR